MNKEISLERIIDAIDSVTWYNGLSEAICDFEKLPVKEYYGKYKLIPAPDVCWDNPQLQMIWMISVIMFGDYGTSPRSGWIEDIEGFKEFIKEITKTYRESEEYQNS